MPKLYEYFGLIFLFYSQEHEPLHVHCKFQDTESKAEIRYENGKFKEVVIKQVQGKKPLNPQNQKKFNPITSYKPQGNLIYNEDLLNSMEDKFN